MFQINILIIVTFLPLLFSIFEQQRKWTWQVTRDQESNHGWMKGRHWILPAASLLPSPTLTSPSCLLLQRILSGCPGFISFLYSRILSELHSLLTVLNPSRTQLSHDESQQNFLLLKLLQILVQCFCVCVCVSNSPANVLNILIGVYSALSFILHLSPENQLANQCKRKLLTEYCHSHTSFSSILDRIASATLLKLKSNHTISLTKTYLALQHPEWSSAVAAVAMIFLM